MVSEQLDSYIERKEKETSPISYHQQQNNSKWSLHINAK
jgi:hypothetical protein